MSKKSPKGRQSRNLRIRVQGGTAPSRTTWVEVRKGKKRIWIKQADFMTDVSSVKSRLARAGIIILGASNWNEFMAQVAAVSEFPNRSLVEQSGWSGKCFALQSGQVFAPDGARGICVFDPNPLKCVQSGTLQGWLERVVAPLMGQRLALFMLMVMFVAPILKLTNRAGNFGFELVGAGGKGKSMLLKLMASVVGGATDDAPTRYWNTCKTTVNALEKKAEAHSDLPMLLDDATSFAGTESGGPRGRLFKQFVFDLAQGETKHRFDNQQQRWFRLVYCITSNLSLADVIAEVAEDERGATQDRHISFNTDIPAYNTFDIVPAGYPDIKSYADALIAGMATEYGTAMPHFLQALVEHRASDEEGLKAGIAKRVEDFINSTGANRNDGSSSRVAEAFGLVVAAASLARHYGTLPKEIDYKAVGLAAYRLHLASAQRLSAHQRLRAYAADARVVDMEECRLKHVTEAQLRAVPGVFRLDRKGRREFHVHPRVFKAAFPDHKTLLKDPEVSALRLRDGRHRGPKRELIKGSPDDRFYSFLLPEEVTKVRM
ncbi:DUF927 domain-containing protein [Sphingomonas mesophila]|uniref:DUF927 domain-containing protein n=1 Tax=Sphingomonas mesophila TaxID=2303576 RepID=UPI000E57DDAF|nr:DUF927 domain-containing protein [Sphingomonas mesophila]